VSNRGYALENQTENFLLTLADQSRDLPMSLRSHRITSSGAMRGDKGDVISVGIPFLSKQLLFECKRRKESTKGGMSFTLPEAWLTKNEGEANMYNCTPIFLGAFTSGAKWRKFIVVSPNTLKMEPNPAPILPRAILTNKNHRFKIRKNTLDTEWNENYKVSLLLRGKRDWILLSYRYFTEILGGLKNEYQIRTQTAINGKS